MVNEIPIEFRDQHNFLGRLEALQNSPINIAIGGVTAGSQSLQNLRSSIEQSLQNITISIAPSPQSIQALTNSIQQAVGGSTYEINVAISAASIAGLQQQIQDAINSALGGGGGGNPPPNPPNPPSPRPRRRGGRNAALIREYAKDISRGLPTAAGNQYPQSRLGRAFTLANNNRTGTSGTALAFREVLNLARIANEQAQVADLNDQVSEAIYQLGLGNAPGNVPQLQQALQSIGPNINRKSLRNVNTIGRRLGTAIHRQVLTGERNQVAGLGDRVSEAIYQIGLGNIPGNIPQLQQDIQNLQGSGINAGSLRNVGTIGRRLGSTLHKETLKAQAALVRDQARDSAFDELSFYRDFRGTVRSDIKRGLYDQNDPRLIQGQFRLRSIVNDPSLVPSRRDKAAKELEAIQRDRNNADERIRKATEEAYKSGIFADTKRLSERFNIDQSKINKGPLFSTARLSDPYTQRTIARNSAEALLFQGPLQAIGSALGGSVGGSVAGEAGAAGGTFFGVAAVNIAIGAFHKLTETLGEAAKAGLAYQRSIVAISSVLLQNTNIVDARTGVSLSEVSQLAINRNRASEIQSYARSAAASVGIAGEAESNLTQAIITGAGSRGITLKPQEVAQLTQRFGAAINLLAPDLLNSPNYIRRDVTDIFSGSGAASRTTLGSRLGPILSQIPQAQSGAELIRFSESMEALVATFQNSNDAVVQMQRFDSQIQKIQQDFGKSFVDQLGPAIGEFTRVISDPQLTQSLSEVGRGLGEVTAGFVNAAASLITITDKLKIRTGITLDKSKPASSSIAYDIPFEFISNPAKFVTGLLKGGKSFIDLITGNSKAPIDDGTKTKAAALTKSKALFGEVPLLEQLAGEGALTKLEKSRQGFAISGFSNDDLRFANFLVSGKNRTEGLKALQDVTASLKGETLAGKISGVESRFSGTGSFSNQLSNLNDQIAETQKELLRYQELSGGTEDAQDLNNRRISELQQVILNLQVEGQSVRDKRLSSIYQLGELSSQSVLREGQTISRVGFIGRRKSDAYADAAELAEITALQSKRSGISPAEQSDLDTVIAGKFARREENIASRRIGAIQDLGQLPNLGKGLIAATTAVEQLPNAFKELQINVELASDSVKNFAEESKLAGLQGEERVVGLIQKARQAGNVALTSAQSDLLTQAFGARGVAVEAEGVFGSDNLLSSQFRKKDIASSELTVALQEEVARKKTAGKTLLEREDTLRDLEAQKSGFGFETLGRRIQEVLALGSLSQFLEGGSEDNPFKEKFQQGTAGLVKDFPKFFGGAEIDPTKVKIPTSPNESLKKAADSMESLVTYMKGQFSKDLASAMEGIFGNLKN